MSGTLRLSIDFFKHLQVVFKSSCQFPLPAIVCFAAQTAQPAPTIVLDPACRSGVDLADPGAKEDL